jgi:hypothetical protein
MKIKCEYCNSYIDESEEKCPTCGAPNKDFKRVANQVPTTIEELEVWYKDHNLPPYETTRFFIGIDYKEPKAFGIYKDDKTGKFVVYKNKDTGERKIRYEGKDEKYAVNELYTKLKEEILNQKSLNSNRSTPRGRTLPKSALIAIIAAFVAPIVIELFVVGLFFILPKGPSRGYYNINGQEYYYVRGNWYVYNNDWIYTSQPDYSGDINDYYDGYSYSSSDSYTDITNSSVYDESWESSSDSSSSDDWDSDSSWDSSDSWDSGGTDWGSDW